MTLERLLALDATQVKSALRQAAQWICEALDAEKVDIFFYDSPTHSLLALGVNDSLMSRHEKALSLDRLQVANGGSAVDVFTTGRTFWSGHLDEDQNELLGIRTPAPQGLGVVSQIVAPIEMQGERRGVLMVANALPEFFSGQDLHFLEVAARWIGMIMHRAEWWSRADVWQWKSC